MNTDDDLKLIQEFQDGDNSAFTKLYEKYYPIAKGFFIKDPLTRDYAEDYCQDIFIKLLRAIHVGNIKNFKNLFYMALMNKQRDLIRQKYRKDFTILSLFDDVGGDGDQSEAPRNLLDMLETASSMNPDEQYYYMELQEVVQSCLNKFEDEKRRTIIALKLDGFKEHQIAAILDINPHTVSSNWGRGKKMLRDCIKNSISPPA